MKLLVEFQQHYHHFLLRPITDHIITYINNKLIITYSSREVKKFCKRQGNYASVSFLLSGAFAVGAILTIPYLAICISLAVAALTFLAVGCYCSYKANTVLSNVEVKNGVDSAAMKVLNSPS